MQEDWMYKLTGTLSLGFGAYCIIMAVLVVAFELVAFSIIFAMILLGMGVLYALAGISMLKRGRWSFIILFGFFGSTFWWSGGIPYYYWPMIIMPVIILALMIILLFKQFVRAR